MDDPCGRSGPNPPFGTSSGWWVIIPWCLGAVYEFIGTAVDRRSTGSGCEKAADADLNFPPCPPAPPPPPNLTWNVTSFWAQESCLQMAFSVESEKCHFFVMEAWNTFRTTLHVRLASKFQSERHTHVNSQSPCCNSPTWRTSQRHAAIRDLCGPRCCEARWLASTSSHLGIIITEKWRNHRSMGASYTAAFSWEACGSATVQRQPRCGLEVEPFADNSARCCWCWDASFDRKTFLAHEPDRTLEVQPKIHVVHRARFALPSFSPASNSVEMHTPAEGSWCSLR